MTVKIPHYNDVEETSVVSRNREMRLCFKDYDVKTQCMNQIHYFKETTGEGVAEIVAQAMNEYYKNRKRK